MNTTIFPQTRRRSDGKRVAIRVSPNTLAEIHQLQAVYDCSQAEVVRVAVARMRETEMLGRA